MTDKRVEIALVGFLAVFVGLLIVYRSWRRALTPVLPIILVTGWSSGVMWFLGMELNPLTAVMSALIIGVGTEFAVLLLERFWEELGHGVEPREAMKRAVSRIGRAIAASGLTVAAGFGALMASSFPAIREFGVVTVIDVLLALVATIVVVPPLALWLVRRRQTPVAVS
jgi:predicted RND superfamily exporter protein